jgi:hypothetical protein
VARKAVCSLRGVDEDAETIAMEYGVIGVVGLMTLFKFQVQSQGMDRDVEL